ncbi:MAG: tetratricopeptide repeat protein, partial [Sedimenticolaceae bacterium]
NTALRLIDITPTEQETSLLDMVRGAFQSFSRKPKFLKVNTPYLNGSVEGTEFAVRTEEGKSSITVFEGVVVAANAQGEVSVRPGESAEAAQGQAPQIRIVVRPRDLVQWALYYPPILSLSAFADASPALQKAANCAANGNTACAFDALAEVPPADQDARYLLVRASLLLSVGRIDQARAAIDDALQRNPNESAAYALRAVIAVALNDNEAALVDGRRAVELDPASAAASIALSYALQANFQIEAAIETMLSAVEQSPDDALAVARLAELELMRGNRSKALGLAQQAKEISPGLARTELVLGFNALASFRNEEAKAAFERAIGLDSADPLAHLGLGLAKISAGQLTDGRRDLEAAVALDGNNALLRAYLGKAYFEEKRFPLDSEQYSIAKQLDPNDPTAFLYDGILKQTINRPVEAVEDLEKSVELNDNRAVYRSRLLLDKDRAARGTSLARAYNDLGFEQLGINQATESLSFDPSNAAAHRFLADSLLGARRTEIARVSETLQAQMLQDVNINPVQPSLAATNLNIITLGGAAQPGFNEFTPLFERNEAQLNATGFGGNNDTYGGEAVVSGVYDRFSFSTGATSYDTDGWRDNNDIDITLYNAFAQFALTDELNIQAEYQYKDSKEGDLAFNFDPDDFLRDKTIKRNQKTTRLGLRYAPTQASTFLFSYIHNNNEEKLKESEALDPFTTSDADSKVDDDGDQYEGQYIYLNERFNLIAGGAHSKSDVKFRDDITLTDVDFGPIFSIQETSKEDTKQSRGYGYVNVPMLDGRVKWTVGVSYDDYEEDILDETVWGPKFGVQWSVTEDVLLRAAAFRTVKPLLINNRTLEPTQVAGFNQFYDDINGTKAWRYALGADWRIAQNLAAGVEVTHRDLDEPVFLMPFDGPPRTDFEDREEDFHRLYVYWTPSARWGVTGEIVYDRFKADSGEATEFDNVPEKVRTVSLPIAATYFHPSGLFGGLQGTYVDQHVKRSSNAPGADGKDDFFLVDLAVGYRLPKRSGILSLGIKNVFDKDFKYQDNSYREFSSEASTGPYFPDRTIMGQLTISF